MRRLMVASVCAVVFFAPAVAADMAVKAKPAEDVFNWSGFYLGGHAGYGWTTSNMSAADAAAITATYGGVPSPKGFIAGFQGGYDWQLANRWVVGLGLELGGFGIDSVHSTTGIAPVSSLKSTIDWDVTPFVRVGYAWGRTLPYLLVGASFDRNHVRGFNGAIGAFDIANWHTGFTVGAGVETMLWNRWSGRVQYRYVTTDSRTYITRSISGTGSLLDVGINYRF